MHIEIPDDLGVTEEQARLDFAVGLYSSHTASLARAARLAGRSRVEFQRILAERGIPLAYDSEDLDDDIATLKRLGQL
jgi:predicted HTH domain antitoxin